VKYRRVEGAPQVPIVCEQGTKMGRQSFIYIELTYDGRDIPSRIEVGGSVMPIVRAELL
jgi:predicted PhzF superfamily epimerase YddE/YHI9